jgi:hypothetical protein
VGEGRSHKALVNRNSVAVDSKSREARGSSSSPVGEGRSHKALANRNSVAVDSNSKSREARGSSSSPVAEHRRALANRSSAEVGANNRVLVGSVTRIAARDSSSEASDRRIGRKVATNLAVLSVRGLLTGRRVEVADATFSEAARIPGAATANLDRVGGETGNKITCPRAPRSLLFLARQDAQVRSGFLANSTMSSDC